MNTGIMGGTFNPVHQAHLRIAEEVRDRLSLDRVLFIPAATPPHKPLAGDLSLEIRLEMVALAIAGNPGFSVTDLEGRRPGKSYTMDTLTALTAEFPDDRFSLIIGSDSFLEIGTWHRYPEIFASCSLAVVERPGSRIDRPDTVLPADLMGQFRYYPAEQRLIHSSGHDVHYLEGVPLDISSSAIRRLAAQGRSIRYLVPEPVEHYITEQRLYTDDQ